jgi:hypothetical protein
MSQWWEWVAGNDVVLAWLGGISLLTFVGSLLALPVLVSRIPRDYFAGETRHLSKTHPFHPVVYGLLIVLKNLLGVALIAAGIAMLVLPGQGLLTILIGVSLMDFPGKFTLERWLVGRPGVLKAINWLRERYGEEPLIRPRLD